MKTSDFNYNLPQELIAQKPAEPRDSSRLMVVDKKNKNIEHKIFTDIVNYFQKGDLLVWNNSKVFKARLFGQLISATGRILRDHDNPIEIFLVRPMENTGVWKVLARPGKHVQAGVKIVFAKDFYCGAIIKETDGTILVQFSDDENIVRQKANQYGHIPIPPYVKDEPHELEIYQTIYANKDKEGSVAAPTAGFHFTDQVVEKLKAKGVEFADVTLHVGLGTFLPVKSERIEDHTMHSEWIEVLEETVEKINLAKSEGRRVTAVGTTTVRTLEGVACFGSEPAVYKLSGRRQHKLRSYKGDINIFIKPGFEFQIVDAMITNFHLPKSTLLMLASAFAGNREFMLECYKSAVDNNYRFYSFGDGMFIY
ncbi:MAG: tRNA preQ1(34) S-adenosylmethionine ribosyltransferase-isomerase QueA [Candidatus Magasanikbacteria bacterium CG_4_10_14_0_2_um_filter_37_12]|uniref:S-adenosylmethionine:tRNA ribosyltransferase-isomerase n=1 Tax=Candidatus Magasanikbacteria bacterium CG_4_10_14_0_2_um_filter_37_12 TaxID=1974637 RepID=A0A2M7V7K4_9BACT|nr:MAG: tRNA preQ1(34) S-adenosylmethionine ribosyltransferase-isomerase QueA [Candidatus Magasanikbacteria bacterium CG_4_10_14_0_2_um_filter_37_12]